MAGIDTLRAQRLGAQVWDARDRAGVGEAELARRIGISTSELATIENGTHPRTQELAQQALRALAQQRPVASRIIERVTRHLN